MKYGQMAKASRRVVGHVKNANQAPNCLNMFGSGCAGTYDRTLKVHSIAKKCKVCPKNVSRYGSGSKGQTHSSTSEVEVL